MSTTRLVEVETIDCVIEQLVYVRDRYEEENDELRTELSAIKKQRDELLAALKDMLNVYGEMISHPPYHHTQELWAKVQGAIELRDAIAKAEGGAE